MAGSVHLFLVFQAAAKLVNSAAFEKHACQLSSSVHSSIKGSLTHDDIRFLEKPMRKSRKPCLTNQ